MSITNKLTYLEQTKEGIKQAIINKGVNVSDSDTFRSYIDKIDSITTGGGSGSDCNVSTCWDSLGYNDVPQYLDDAVTYGAQIKDTWDASSTSFNFSNNADIIYFPSLDVSNVSIISFGYDTNLQYVGRLNVSSKIRELNNLFNGCKKLMEVDGINTWDTSGVTTMSFAFSDCESLKSLDLSNWDVSNVTNMWKTFYNCSSLTSLDLSGWNTSNVTDMTTIIGNCTKLEKVDGFLDLTSCDYSSSYSYFFGYGSLSTLRKIAFKNIGYKSAKTAIDFTKILNWGVDTDTVTDARQSLIDSLITYSFDRATAGYATHTITLGTQTKAVLTESEIAQITAKGYTIA